MNAKKEHEDLFFRAFHSSLTAMAIACAATHQFLEVNRQFERLTGYHCDELIGRSAEQSGLWDVNEVRETLEAVGEVPEWEVRLQRKDGALRDVLVSIVVVKIGDTPCWLFNLLDITERKQAEKALRNNLNGLAQEVQQRVADIESFVYAVTHDLRAPLMAIEGFAQALLEDYGERLNEKGQDYCRHIIRSAQRMHQLIDALLEYGQMLYRDMPLQPVSLDQALQDALQLLGAYLSQKAAKVDVSPSLPEVIANHTVLVQVLVNLVSNAVKFVPPERSPCVQIWAEKVNGWVRLCVRDNGIGIPKEEQDRIFRPFARLHPTSSYPGVGMGLVIAKRGVERMGGRIGVESEPSKGSCFWVDLLPAPSQSQQR